MPTQLTQIEREPLDALTRMSWEKTFGLARAGHNPDNKTRFIDQVNLGIIAKGNSNVDQGDIDTANALATPELAIAAIEAIANP